MPEKPTKPTTEFGRRKPVAIQPAQPVKRGQVALLLMGTLAVGGGAYGLMPSENCAPNPPGMAAPQGGAECRPRGSSSGSGGSSSRYSFYSGNSSSSHSPSGTSSSGTASDSGSGNVTRGGFGGFAHAFGSHFSGG
jgi:hypothetical protein